MSRPHAQDRTAASRGHDAHAMLPGRSWLLPCSVVALAVAALAASAPPSAAAACAAGFQDAGGSVCTRTFAYSGSPVPLTLPATVRGILVTVSGAEGGSSLEEQVDPFGGAPSPGGKGGRESATIPVAAGASVTVVVGQMGTGGPLDPGGYGGYGGGGHASSRYGGNGGGGSFVFGATGPLIAAGGGGGGGYDYNPVVLGHGDQQNAGGDGSGASQAGDGASVSFCCDGTAPAVAGGGGGAWPGGGGAGGHPTLGPGYAFGQADGDAGSGPAFDENNFGNGGATHNGCCYYTGWAGGGGGGYYGGGGGGNIEAELEGGGGGGGAGFVVAKAWATDSATGVQAGDGEVTLSYYRGACHASCATCTGPLATDCSSCAPGFVVAAGSCVPGSSTTTTTTSTTTTTTLALTTTTLPQPPLCGDMNGDQKISASDALGALRTAVGTSSCASCVCDANDSGAITASDALAILRFGVGLPVDLACPPC